MLLINKSSISADGVENYKAPKGLQYLVTSFLVLVSAIASPTLLIVNLRNYNVEEFSSGDALRDPIAMYAWEFDTTVPTRPPTFQVLDINETSKYLSVQTEIGGTVQINYLIYGELVPISRTDAIIEWFKKGR